MQAISHSHVSIVTVSLLLTAANAVAQSSATDNDLERFRGHWQVLEMVEDGRGIPENQMRNLLPGGGVLEIVDYTILFKSPIDGAKSAKTFRLDATSYPKRIAIMERDSTTGVGIYKFDQGKLVVCVSKQSAESFSEFSAAQGSGRTLIVLQRFEPGKNEVPGSNAKLPERQSVGQAQSTLPAPDAIPASARQVTSQPSPPQAASREATRILTDDEVRNMALGTWRMEDIEGSIDIMFDAKGMFQTYRYHRTLANFQFIFVPTPVSSGTWSIVDGRLIANVTASTRLDRVNQTFVPAVRSISATDMILVDHLGRVSRAVKLR